MIFAPRSRCLRMPPEPFRMARHAFAQPSPPGFVRHYKRSSGAVNMCILRCECMDCRSDRINFLAIFVSAAITWILLLPKTFHQQTHLAWMKLWLPSPPENFHDISFQLFLMSNAIDLHSHGFRARDGSIEEQNDGSGRGRSKTIAAERLIQCKARRLRLSISFRGL